MLIATDLDGTLVPNDSTVISGYTADVLARVDRAGVPVVFVTARPLRWMDGFWPYVARHGLAIVSNGAIVYDARARAVRALSGIAPADGLALTEVIARAVPGATFAIECLDGIRQDPNFRERYRVPDGSPRGPLADIWDAPAVKVLVRHERMADEEFRDRVVAVVGDAATATWSVPGLVEISASGVTKATALTTLCRELGVPAAEVIAFGDMPNDLLMLAWAGRSYAMANAHQSVLDAADFVAPACEHDGVAQVLDTLIGGSGIGQDDRPRDCAR